MLSPLDSEADAVRLADSSDEEELLAMCRDLHCESGIRDGSNQPLPFDAEKAREMVQRAVVRSRNAPDAGQSWCGIIGTPGRLEASVYLTVTAPWYSQAPFLAEIWNFVAPHYRQSTHAKCLIAFSKTVAATLKMPLVMGVLSTERQPAKMRFYAREIGCQPAGGFFVFNSDRAAAGVN